MLEEGKERALQFNRRIILIEVRWLLHLMKLVLGESAEVLACGGRHLMEKGVCGVHKGGISAELRC